MSLVIKEIQVKMTVEKNVLSKEILSQESIDRIKREVLESLKKRSFRERVISSRKER